MSEALKAFEEELQSKNFKGYWQSTQGDVYREPVPSFAPCFWKGKDLFAAMEKAGVPAFSPIQDSRFYFNYHHSAADTLDKIVPKQLAETSAVVAVAVYALANAEQPLPR